MSRPCGGALAARQQALGLLARGKTAFSVQRDLLPINTIERIKCDAAIDALDVARTALATVWAQMDAENTVQPVRGDA